RTADLQAVGDARLDDADVVLGQLVDALAVLLEGGVVLSGHGHATKAIGVPRGARPLRRAGRQGHARRPAGTYSRPVRTQPSARLARRSSCSFVAPPTDVMPTALFSSALIRP